MIGIGDEHRQLTVGREGVVSPVGPELGLVADQAGAADDQPEALERGLGDLRLPGLGVVGDRDPVSLGDRVDQLGDRRLIFTPIENSTPRAWRTFISLWFSNPSRRG